MTELSRFAERRGLIYKRSQRMLSIGMQSIEVRINVDVKRPESNAEREVNARAIVKLVKPAVKTYCVLANPTKAEYVQTAIHEHACILNAA